jgi:hypothetical protein
LLNLRTRPEIAADTRVAVIIDAGDVRDGFTDKEEAGNGVGGLDARTGDNVDFAILRDGVDGHIEIVHRGEIAKPARVAGGEIRQRIEESAIQHRTGSARVRPK